MLEINPDNNQVILRFVFESITSPFHITIFPSFVSLNLGGERSPNGNQYTTFQVELNASIINDSVQGRFLADELEAEIESIFNFSLPYEDSYIAGQTIFITYGFDICSSYILNNLRSQFLKCCPSNGFGKIASRTSINDYGGISFTLQRFEDSMTWTVSMNVDYSELFEFDVNQEYTISLKELTGFNESIQPSLEASGSSLSMRIIQNDVNYKILFLEIIPDMVLDKSIYEGRTTYYYSDVFNDTVDDVSVRFRIVPPNYIDPEILTVINFIIIMTIIIVVITIIANYKGFFKKI